MGEGVGQPEGSSEKLDPLERVKAGFESQGLMRLLGADVVDAGEEFCTTEVPFSFGVTQLERNFHGAVIGAIGDNAGGYTALTLAPPGQEVLAVEYKVGFLALAFGEKLVARGEVVTVGRRLFVCRAEVSAVRGSGPARRCRRRPSLRRSGPDPGIIRLTDRAVCGVVFW